MNERFFIRWADTGGDKKMSKSGKQGIVSWSLVAVALFAAQSQTARTAPDSVVVSSSVAWTATAANQTGSAGFFAGL